MLLCWPNMQKSGGSTEKIAQRIAWHYSDESSVQIVDFRVVHRVACAWIQTFRGNMLSQSSILPQRWRTLFLRNSCLTDYKFPSARNVIKHRLCNVTREWVTVQRVSLLSETLGSVSKATERHILEYRNLKNHPCENHEKKRHCFKVMAFTFSMTTVTLSEVKMMY